MLDTMRHIASGVVAKALMFLLVISFAVWGVGDILRNTGATYAAKVGGQTISVGEFQQQKAMVSRQMQAMGVNMDVSKLEVGILRQLIQEKLILATMHDAGLYVNDPLLAKALRSNPQFQDNDGKFNAGLFKATLQVHQMSEGTYLAQLKRETAGKFLLSSLDVSDITPPSSILALSAAAANETRDATLVTIPARASSKAASEEELRSYYDAQKNALYLQPETRVLEYVTLAPSDVTALVDKSITADMLSEEAAAKPSASKESIKETLRSEQRDQVMRELSNNVEDALAAGSSLADALGKAGIKSPTHTLNNVTADEKNSADEVTKTVAEQGFSLNEGEISGLITTPKGTALMVAVKKVNSAAPKPFEQVTADVKTRFAQQQARSDARDRALEVKAELAKEADWQTALSKLQLSGRAVSNLSRPVEGKPASSGVPVLLQQAIFERPVGDVAGPLTLANGDQVIAIITASRHPKTAPDAKQQAATAKQLSESLNRTIQSSAFNAFADQHPVKINPAVLTPADAQ